MDFCFMAGDGAIELLKRRKAAADRERGSGLKIFPLPCDNIFNFLFRHLRLLLSLGYSFPASSSDSGISI